MEIELKNTWSTSVRQRGNLTSGFQWDQNQKLGHEREERLSEIREGQGKHTETPHPLTDTCGVCHLGQAMFLTLEITSIHKYSGDLCHVGLPFQ